MSVWGCDSVQRKKIERKWMIMKRITQSYSFLGETILTFLFAFILLLLLLLLLPQC